MISENCIACGACLSVCSTRSIELKENDMGFYSACIKEDACVSCNKCKEVCPNVNGYEPNKDMQKFYLFVNGRDYYRNLSSSGGFFHAVSEQVLDMNGVVFGAYLDESFTVKHGWTETIEDIYRFMSSKYVQSYLGDTYSQVRSFLEKGRVVLFSGTPCQIAGLNSFLGCDYENLYTIELFCGGIPSPVAWKSYLNDYHNKEEIRYVQFRYKSEGWWKYGLRIQFLHDDYYNPSRSMKDPYMTSYLKDYNVNTPCFNCNFKKEKKNADFTIGDAWNINRIRCNMDDNRGITSVFINSEKAQKILRNLKDKHLIFSQNKEEALFVRGELEAKKIEPPNRENFLKNMMEKGFRYAYEKNIV